MKIRSSALGGSALLQGKAQGGPSVPVHSHPMAELLFGKRPPKLVDRRKYPKLKRGMGKLGELKEHIATGLLGKSPEDFELVLCEGDNASISRDLTLAIGVDLLGEHQDDDDLLLAILGHEMGHQPWDWPRGDFSSMKKSVLNAMYREEEAKADRFCGKVLAELNGNPDAIERFLRERSGNFEGAEPQDYYPVDVRVKMIRGAFERKHRSVAMRRLLSGE